MQNYDGGNTKGMEACLFCFFAEGQGGIPKSAREQKENNTFSGVHSRRLGGWANLESEKHASKLGAFAIFLKRIFRAWISAAPMKYALTFLLAPRP